MENKMKPITQEEVDELKTYLWGKINELEEDNKLLKVAVIVSLILIVALVMASTYALTGSII